MINKEIYSYTGGMDCDTPPSKRGKNVYSMLRNGRITSSYASGEDNNIGSDGIVRCANGNKVVFGFGAITSIVTGYNNTEVTYNIINSDGDLVEFTQYFAATNDGLSTITSSISDNYIIATYSDGPSVYLLTTSSAGIDCIWRYDENDVSSHNPELIYIAKLGWSESYNYDIVINHESESVKRMYIADGVHQVFSINLLSDRNSSKSIIGKPSKVFYMVPSYSFSQPVITGQISGGSLSTGYIQYAYNLFNINGGQTNISPLSEMKAIGRSNGGGNPDEIVGKSNLLKIDNIDTGYDYLRIYSIKYNSLNTTPTVGIVGDYAIDGATSITATDDGIPQYVSTIDVLQFLGGIELVPRCIVGKKNRLIAANIIENPWNINNDLGVDNQLFFDSRCYSSSSGGIVMITDSSESSLVLDITDRVYTGGGSDVPLTYDCYQTNEYMFHPTDLSSPGGEGRHLSYKIKQTSTASISSEHNITEVRHMKSGERYRWAIQFYNNKSQKSTPQWIADVRVPSGYHGMNNSKRVTIEFTISAAGQARLIAQGVIGYKFLRVERKDSDKSIVAQGIVSPMIFQRLGNDAKKSGRENATYGAQYANGAVKVPSPWLRHLQDQVDASPWTGGGHSRPAIKVNALSNYGCISPTSMNPSDDSSNAPWAEIYRDSDPVPSGAAWLHLSYQDNRLMQLFSPETIFAQPLLTGGMKARVVGSLQQSARKAHGKMINTDSSDTFVEVSSDTSTTLFSSSAYNSDPWNSNYLNANGYIGPNKPTYDLWRKTEQLIAHYRQYTFHKLSTNTFDILGTPELAKHDTQVRTYNGNGKYKYQNTLQSIVADGKIEDLYDYVNESWDQPIFGVDAIATQNITFVDSLERPYETIIGSSLSSIDTADNLLLVEIYNEQSNQYGGYKHEDRTLNKYIEVGKYKTINTLSYNIIDCGDTFVGDFTFARIARIDGVNFSHQRMQYTEMVTFPVETSINIFNRSDNSYAGWEAQFLPTNESFHKYNNVFSQEGNALYSIPDPYLFTKNTNFSNRILASKPKISGEIIDSWLDLLPNEELYVEGEYGPINRLLKLNDSLYCFQRDGVCAVSVLPRVQVAASDSIAIELGVGQVLNTYQYLNTQSGCEDFNGIISTSSSVYYADRIRRSINIITSSGVSGLSDKTLVSSYVKGFETTYTNKPAYTLGFDPITDDVLFAIRPGHESVAPESSVLMFSENIGRFFGVYDFSPYALFTVDGKLHSIPSEEKNMLYSHFTNSDSCVFYGQQKALELTVCLNPGNAIGDVIFDSVEWTHDVYNTEDTSVRYNDNITGLIGWNEYLTSYNADVNDIRRRLRISRLYIPRSNADPRGISRMRGQYLYVKISYLPDSPNKTILLNDLILSFNAQRK